MSIPVDLDGNHSAHCHEWAAAFRGRKLARPFRFVSGLRHPVLRGDYCPYHSHPALEIVFHPSGKGITTAKNGSAIPFCEGGVVIYPPNEMHDQTMERDGEDVCIQVALPRSVAQNLSGAIGIPDLNSRWLVEELEQLGNVRTLPDPDEQEILDHRVTAVLLASVRAATAASVEDSTSAAMQRIQKVKGFIADNFAKIGSLGEVAEHAGISHDHLRHLFKSQTGKPLIQYLNEVRLAHAQLLLTNSPLPLKQIATLCGFRDEFYFSAVFRKHLRSSPGAFRAGKLHGLRFPSRV